MKTKHEKIKDIFNGVSTYTSPEGELLMHLDEFATAIEQLDEPAVSEEEIYNDDVKELLTTFQELSIILDTMDEHDDVVTLSQEAANIIFKRLQSWQPTVNTLSKANVIEVLRNASPTNAICTCDECVEEVAEAILSKLKGDG